MNHKADAEVYLMFAKEAANNARILAKERSNADPLDHMRSEIELMQACIELSKTYIELQKLENEHNAK